MKKPVAIVIFLLLLVGVLTTYQRPAEEKAFMPFSETQSSKEIEEDSKLVSTVQPAKLSAETKRIISGLGFENIEIFDLTSVEESPMMIKLWIEVFENGEKQTDILNFSSGRSMRQNDHMGKSQVIISTKLKENEEKDTRTFSVSAAIVDDGGAASSANEIILPINWGGRLSGPLNSEKQLQINRPVTLITVIEDNGNGIGYSSSDIEQYDETGEVTKEILAYDRVFLYRIMLEKE